MPSIIPRIEMLALLCYAIGKDFVRESSVAKRSALQIVAAGRALAQLVRLVSPGLNARD